MISERATEHEVAPMLSIGIQPALTLTRGQQRGMLIALLGLALIEMCAVWFATNGVASYALFDRPSWALSTSMLVPAWTMLLMLAACASWLGVRAGGSRHTDELIAIYVGYLFTNALWHMLLMGRHLGAAAVAASLLMVGLVLFHILVLTGLRRSAAMLLMPCLAWTTYIVIVTAGLWRTNALLR